MIICVSCNDSLTSKNSPQGLNKYEGCSLILVIDSFSLTQGCSLILVIDSFSPKPSSIPEENYLVVKEWFFAILKSPNHFKMIQLVMSN